MSTLDEFVQYKSSANDKDTDLFNRYLVERIVQSMEGFISLYKITNESADDKTVNDLQKVIDEFTKKRQEGVSFKEIPDQPLGALDYNIIKRYVSDLCIVSASSGTYFNARKSELSMDRVKDYFKSIDRLMDASENLLLSFKVTNSKPSKKRKTVPTNRNDSDTEEDRDHKRHE